MLLVNGRSSSEEHRLGFPSRAIRSNVSDTTAVKYDDVAYGVPEISPRLNFILGMYASRTHIRTINVASFIYCSRLLALHFLRACSSERDNADCVRKFIVTVENNALG